MLRENCVAQKFTDGMDFLKHMEDLGEKWKSATEKGASFLHDLDHIYARILVEDITD